LKIEDLLDEVLKRDASDLQLTVGVYPAVRVDGFLQPLGTYQILTKESIKILVHSVLNDQQKEILENEKEVDFSFAYGDLARFRANAYHQKGNISMSLRLIPSNIRSVDDLGMPQICNTFADYSQGLVLVTGPTGSGKSTTIAAMIEKVNQERAEHIITIEDPIEYNYQNKMSMIAQRELHYDTKSFGNALRAVLREDPNVVLVGEMRDLETISSAITIAETGHLVFTTLHTNSAAQTIDRIIDVFPPHQQQQIRIQLSSILIGVISQRLIPAIGGGRIPAAEVLIMNDAVRNVIREGKTHQLDNIIQTGAAEQMQTMDSDLARLVKSGRISLEDAKQYAINLKQLERLVSG